MILAAAASISTGTAIGIAAFVISGTSLLMVAITTRRKADQGYVDRLEHRITDSERRLTECEHARDALKDENLLLMRKVLGLTIEPIAPNHPPT